MRLLAVMGEGGHTKEMVRLIDLLGPEYDYGYVLVEDDDLSEKKITRAGPVFRVVRPRDKAHNLFGDIWKALKCAAQAASVVRRFRPDAVISTGPSVAVPVAAVARLTGARIIFIETGSRVRALSTTGKIMYRLAHLYFVQWEPLLALCPRARYAGRLW
jgi:beta-1,4-N-acetylglucosaminyltransferase